MATFDEVVAEAEAGGLPTDQVTIITSAADGVALAQLQTALQQAAELDETTNEPNRAPAIARQIAELEATAKTTTFTIQALSDKAFSDLEREHPPAEGQYGRHDPDTFEPALVAACIIEPQGATVESVDRLRGSIATSEWQRLNGAVMGLCLAGQSPPSRVLGRAFDDLLASAPS